MMGERGISVDHSTIYRWVQTYAPDMETRLRWQWRCPRSTSWRVDETCVKGRGEWAYLHRAVDKHGNTVDVRLSPTRNTTAAKRFPGKAPTYAPALAELKQDGKCPKHTVHRQAKYLNNVIEAHHGKLKQPIRPVRGFKALRTAYAAIKGFEVMRTRHEGQAHAFNMARDIRGAARIVERAFGLSASALAEVVQRLGRRPEPKAA